MSQLFALVKSATKLMKFCNYKKNQEIFYVYLCGFVTGFVMVAKAGL